MAYLLGFAICLALFIAFYSLWKYGNVKLQHPIVTLSVLIAWSFSFLIVFIIPLDVTATVYRQCLQENNSSSTTIKISNGHTFSNITIGNICQKPWGTYYQQYYNLNAFIFCFCTGLIPDYIFPNLWRIIYWTSQFLTWLIMPLMQSYLKAGDFTFKGKFKSALIDNAIYYGSYLFICGILLIYIAFKGVSLDWQKLKAIASSASNTWGLFLLVLLLGYALVEVPRSLWNNSKPGFTLQYAYFKVAKLSSDKAEAEENVDDVLESLQAANRSIPNNHHLRPHIETILRKVPTELQERANRNFSRGGGGAMSSTIIPSEKALIKLHKNVIKSLQTLQRTEALWSVQVEKVFHLEDVAKNIHAVEKRFKTEFPRHRTNLSSMLYNPIIDWYWECKLKFPFLKSLAIITAVLSIMVVWSELTFFSRKPVLSIFAGILIIAKSNYDFLTIELFSMATLCYLCYCAYSTVFRIKFLNLYYLAPHHATNEHSLIFSGMLLCRLTPPMCLNFLGLIHMDSHIIKERVMETFYTQIMGHMDVIGIISDGFMIYFPMLMMGFCLATWFSLGTRLLNVLGFQQFLQNETIATELVQEGKDLIAREKRRKQRSLDMLSRKRDFNKDFNVPPTSSKVNNRNIRTPTDGLLKDSDPFDYATRDNSGMPRSLSEEINDRFGISTQVKVGYKSNNLESVIDFRDDDDEEEDMRRIGPLPKNIFDDV